MAKKIITENSIKARETLARGANKLAEAIGSTMGPFGQNWFLEKKEAPTNDGVSIAREFNLPDEVENKGVKAIRESAIKTVEEVGDGTSSVIVFANAVYQNLSKYLSKTGIMGNRKPVELKQQLEKEKLEVIEKLKAMATPIETVEQLIDSARVSVEDDELGKLIGEAQFKLGKSGYLLAEETAERTSSVEITKGIRIDNGFGTSQVINNQEKQTLEIEDTKIILTSYTIKDIADWQKVMKICDLIWRQGKTNKDAETKMCPITIIARAWTDETVNFCLQNINKGAKIYPLSAPYVNMQERFKDLQAVLGGRFIDSESAFLEDLQLSDVGFAKKVVARRYDAIITGVDDENTTERINKRVTELKAQYEGSQSDFEKKQLSERIAQLENGFGVVKVGSPSDMERKRLFDKCDDAVNAVRVAFQEGTVKGAGLAFKEIAESLPDTYLLKRPLMSINEQIMFNAPSDFVVEDWVRDPLKVMLTVLEKGIESASALATAGGAIVAEVPKGFNELFQKQLAQSQEGE